MGTSTTALVHEAYLRLVDVEQAQHWDSRGHFFAAGAEAMRRILVESARKKKGHRLRSAREAEATQQQAARQAKVAGQVESIFAEVDPLEKEQKWPEALVVARRSAAAVAGGEAGAETTERVRQRLKDLEFIDRAWQLLTGDPKSRDPAWASKLAQEAAALAPNHAGCQNTLGVAQYRAGNWKAAIEAPEKSRHLNH